MLSYLAFLGGDAPLNSITDDPSVAFECTTCSSFQCSTCKERKNNELQYNIVGQIPETHSIFDWGFSSHQRNGANSFARLKPEARSSLRRRASQPTARLVILAAFGPNLKMLALGLPRRKISGLRIAESLPTIRTTRSPRCDHRSCNKRKSVMT